jgi:DNA modification methylase
MSVRIITGDVRDELATLADRSIQCCVTSPPYYGLRDYGEARQIGLEATPEEYIATLVSVFSQVRRALRDDGTLWLNIGDSYTAARGGAQGASGDLASRAAARAGVRERGVTRRATDCKPKDMIGIPWMLAFALRADGWYLRSEIIWQKPNPMPESVTDRPTKSHEQIFLLSKSERYFYDAEAIKEPAAESVVVRAAKGYSVGGLKGDPSRNDSDRGKALTFASMAAGRNSRSVWTIATTPYKDAHFATFPTELAERCILAGTSPKACEQCSAPFERVTSQATSMESTSARAGRSADDINASGKWQSAALNGNKNLKSGPVVTTTTLGWQPSCECEQDFAGAGNARCVVLDPFGGAGTTALVADRLGRDGVLIELNASYAAMAEQRIRKDSPLFVDVTQ